MIDLLFCCEAPLTTYVLAAIDAWTVGKHVAISLLTVKSAKLVLHEHMIHAPLGLVKWMTVSSMKMLTSSMPGIVFTPNLFRVFCNLLSSVDVVLWTAFFFLHCHSSTSTTRMLVQHQSQ